MCLAVEETDVIEFDTNYYLYRTWVMNNFHRILCLPSGLE